MGNGFGNLRGEGEVSGSLLVPACHGRGAWRAIKRAIDLDRLKLTGIVEKKIARLHARRVETALPAVCGESGSGEENLSTRNLEGSDDFLWGSLSSDLIRLVQLEECRLADRFHLCPFVHHSGFRATGLVGLAFPRRMFFPSNCRCSCHRLILAFAWLGGKPSPIGTS